MVKRKKVSRKKIIRVETDPVFIPIIYDSYRKNKVNLLNAQVKLLECAKRLKKIKELGKQKESLKLQLYRELSEAMRLYYKAQDYLPLVSAPVIKKVEKSVELRSNYRPNQNFSDSPSQSDELDSELREIQEKLNALNSSKYF